MSEDDAARGVKWRGAHVSFNNERIAVSMSLGQAVTALEALAFAAGNASTDDQEAAYRDVHALLDPVVVEHIQRLLASNENRTRMEKSAHEAREALALHAMQQR